MSGGLFAETFGLAIRRTDVGLDMEQHLTEIDQFSGTFQNTQLLFHPIDEADVTGPLLFRIVFDDATNLASTAFSLDCGSTWASRARISWREPFMTTGPSSPASAAAARAARSCASESGTSASS